MESKLPLYKKLTILYRVEPGCLGPDGVNHVDDFCKFAKTKMKSIEKGLLRWIIKPRNDKFLPELEYQLKNVAISGEQAREFFVLYEKDFAKFETMLDETIANLVEEYFERT